MQIYIFLSEWIKPHFLAIFVNISTERKYSKFKCTVIWTIKISCVLWWDEVKIFPWWTYKSFHLQKMFFSVIPQLSHLTAMWYSLLKDVSNPSCKEWNCFLPMQKRIYSLRCLLLCCLWYNPDLLAWSYF